MRASVKSDEPDRGWLSGGKSASQKRDCAHRRPRPKNSLAAAFLAALAASGGTPLLRAQSFDWGGSLRGYQFLRAENAQGGQRRDTELWILRLTSTTSFTPKFKLESHAVVELLSPPLAGASRVATAESPPLLPLQHSLSDGTAVSVQGSFDRLNLQFDLDRVRIIAGRQAISWGVSYFWPAMDLFAPFAPERFDRDYKPGVDAVRFTIPVASYSEIDIIGASLGPSPSRDWAAGALSRFYLGSVDLGLMGGKFHRDTVAGAFITSNLRGTGIRGELTWTDSGDPEDERRGRSRFWRGTLGLDQQLTPEWSLTLEGSWNGYGVDDPAEYLAYHGADRIRRGEVNAAGMIYAGLAANWQVHPLWVLSNLVLINGNDPSGLWVPTLTWSTGNNSELIFGAQLGMGGGFGAGDIPRSEYGSVPATLFVALKGYF